jgi:hypothetical protein
MALVQAALKSDLRSLFNEMRQNEMSESDYADKLAAIITDYIKTAKVTVDAGISVSTSGSAAAQTGSTTAPGTGSLS